MKDREGLLKVTKWYVVELSTTFLFPVKVIRTFYWYAGVRGRPISGITHINRDDDRIHRGRTWSQKKNKIEKYDMSVATINHTFFIN